VAKWYRKDKCHKYAIRRLPVLNWLPRYEISWLLQDALAGITVGLTAIPQGIAYGIIAGLNPEVKVNVDRVDLASIPKHGNHHRITEKRIARLSRDSLLRLIRLMSLSEGAPCSFSIQIMHSGCCFSSYDYRCAKFYRAS